MNRREKRVAMNAEIEKIERSRREGKIRDSHKNIKKIKQDKARNSMTRDGNLKLQEEEVLHILREYFYPLLNRDEAMVFNGLDSRPNCNRPNDSGPNVSEPNDERPDDTPNNHGPNEHRHNNDRPNENI